VRKAEALLDRVVAAQAAEQQAAVEEAIRKYEDRLLTSPVKPPKR
jgi:phage baseplate assembly protein W